MVTIRAGSQAEGLDDEALDPSSCPGSRRAAEAINFVHFAREFKKRQRGERVMNTRGIGRVVRKTQIVKALRTDIE